jgi:hypothetical protein
MHRPLPLPHTAAAIKCHPFHRLLDAASLLLIAAAPQPCKGLPPLCHDQIKATIADGIFFHLILPFLFVELVGLWAENFDVLPKTRYRVTGRGIVLRLFFCLGSKLQLGNAAHHNSYSETRTTVSTSAAAAADSPPSARYPVTPSLSLLPLLPLPLLPLLLLLLTLLPLLLPLPYCCCSHCFCLCRCLS